MAIARVSARDPDPVHSLSEGLQNKLWVHVPGAWNHDYPDIRWILHTAHPGQISGPVGTPAAKKSRDPGLKLLMLTHNKSLVKTVVWYLLTIKLSSYQPVEKVLIEQAVQKSQVQGTKKVQGRSVFIHT